MKSDALPAPLVLLGLFRDVGIPIPRSAHTGGEVFFMKPERDFHFDLAWPAEEYTTVDGVGGGIAVELDGSVFVSGRHTRGVGFTVDTVKINEASLRGWLVLRYPTHVIHTWPDYVLNQIQRAFLAKMGLRVGYGIAALADIEWPHFTRQQRKGKSRRLQH